MKSLRVIIAAGGTGGHIFPALALGEELRSRFADSKILFIGTNRGLEERVIPPAGFDLQTLAMRGFIRGFSPLDLIKNLLLPFHLFFVMWKSFRIVKVFDPHLVIGCGGYVSGPVVLWGALMKKTTVIQEQNSRPGRTTLMLSRFADEVHVTYEDAVQFFSDEKKIKISGNPLRKWLERIGREKACAEFGLDPAKKILLIVGGSLGAHAINAALVDTAQSLVRELNIEVLWQTGKMD